MPNPSYVYVPIEQAVASPIETSIRRVDENGKAHYTPVGIGGDITFQKLIKGLPPIPVVTKECTQEQYAHLYSIGNSYIKQLTKTEFSAMQAERKRIEEEAQKALEEAQKGEADKGSSSSKRGKKDAE